MFSGGWGWGYFRDMLLVNFHLIFRVQHRYHLRFPSLCSQSILYFYIAFSTLYCKCLVTSR